MENEKLNLQTNDLSQEIKPNFPGFVDLFKQSWVIFEKRIGLFLGLTFLPVAIVVPMVIIVLSAVFFGIEKNIALLSVFIAIFFVFYIVAIILGTCCQLAVICLAKDIDKEITFKQALSTAWDKLASFWWLVLLNLSIITVGYLGLIVPGIILGIYLSLSVVILLAEDEKGFKALSKSCVYIQGKFWAVLGRNVVFGLIVLGLALIQMIPFVGIVGYVGAILISPIEAIFCYVIYKNLKEYKEKLKSPELETPYKAENVLQILAIVGACLIALIPIVVGIYIGLAITR